MIGHKEIEAGFKKLAKENNLAHGYIFFGEPQVGKFLFARRLAHFLEKGKFEISEGTLTETLIIKPEIKESGERSIGIDSIRELKNFLFEKPVNSKYRIAIVNDAQYMTDIAQNSILKVAEEPPEHGLIIMIAANPDILLKTVRSRFQKIYFPRVSKAEIKRILIDEFAAKNNQAEDLAGLSFGRPGRAIALLSDERLISIAKEAKEFAERRTVLKNVLAELADIENRDKIEPFLTELIAELAVDVKRNHAALKALIHRHHMLNEWNTNKRIQLEAGLTTIVKQS